MIEKTGALDVYFEKEIEILLPTPDPLEVAEVKKILEENEVEFSEIRRESAL